MGDDSGSDVMMNRLLSSNESISRPRMTHSVLIAQASEVITRFWNALKLVASQSH